MLALGLVVGERRPDRERRRRCTRALAMLLAARQQRGRIRRWAATSSHRDVAFWQDSACALSVRNGACTSMELMEAGLTGFNGATRVECDDVRDMCLDFWWNSAPSEDQDH